MDCPRCGQTGVDSPSCPRCGVVFAKLAAGPRPRPRPTPLPPARPGASRASLVLPALALVAVAAVGVLRLRAPEAPATPPPLPAEPARDEPSSHPAEGVEVPPPELALPELLPSPSPLPLPEDAFPEADRRAAEALAEKLQRSQPVGTADVEAAERLFLRYAGRPEPRRLLESVVLAAAAQARARRDPAAAAEDLRRVARLLPESRTVRATLLVLLLEASDWPGAEAAARDLLAASPGDLEAVRGLAYALIRQDRSREAAELLRAALEQGEDAPSRALLRQIETGLQTEKGMTEQRLAYFNVRYDGEAHEDVGREILRQLEHHRATLVRTFDHEPGATIPVVLFSQRAYYDATGAPVWSGGHYDGFDGRIRIPIGGLTSALTPDMDGTLVHELTHAFVEDRTRGVAPREIHEGLAQYMAGKRVADTASREELQALADRGTRTVGAFYLGALSLTEFLVAERGQGGINDLLRAMGESGDVEASFQRVYGRGYAQVRKDWEVKLRREYGR